MSEEYVALLRQRAQAFRDVQGLDEAQEVDRIADQLERQGYLTPFTALAAEMWLGDGPTLWSDTLGPS